MVSIVDVIFMFKRKIETELIEWKKSLMIKKKAFILKGARQVGKSYIIYNSRIITKAF